MEFSRNKRAMDGTDEAESPVPASSTRCASSTAEDVFMPAREVARALSVPGRRAVNEAGTSKLSCVIR